MLGRTIHDPDRVEAASNGAEGLGLLAIATRFLREKRTARVRALTRRSSLFPEGLEVEGFEIHHGRIERDGASPAFDVLEPERPPYGIGRAEWTHVADLADRLGDALAAQETPDAIVAIELAEELRDATRPA